MSVLLISAALALAASESLTIQTSPAISPCARALTRAFERKTGTRVAVQPGTGRDTQADVLITFDVEMTRALEGGDAVDGSEQEIARIPWVLVLPEGGATSIRSLTDLGSIGDEVWVLAGPVAHEARRALLGVRGLAKERLHETSDPLALDAASIALVPLSVAPRRNRLAVDIRPLEAAAAVGARAQHVQAAREFVAFAASESGKAAFAACVDAP